MINQPGHVIKDKTIGDGEYFSYDETFDQSTIFCLLMYVYNKVATIETLILMKDLFIHLFLKLYVSRSPMR